MALAWRPIRPMVSGVEPLTVGLAAPPPPAMASAEAPLGCGAELYRCGFCRGTGAKPGRILGRSKCPVCQGQGQVALRAPVVTCAYCRGKGQTRRGAKVFCTVCHGKGLVSVAEPVETCPDCNGSRATQTWLPCIRCQGVGVVACSSDGRGAQQAPQQAPSMISLREWKKKSPTASPLRPAFPAEEQAPADSLSAPEAAASAQTSCGERSRTTAETTEGILWKLEKRQVREQPRPPRPRRASLPYLASTLRQREKRAMLAGLRRKKPWWQPCPERVPAGLLRSGVYPCAFCRGSGQPRGQRVKCPSCSGTGLIRLKPPVVRCALCHGRGRANDNLHLACLACKGKGIHPVEEPITRCPQCHGRGGWGAIPCTECGGKGVITHRPAPDEQAEQLWEIDAKGLVRLKKSQRGLSTHQQSTTEAQPLGR